MTQRYDITHITNLAIDALVNQGFIRHDAEIIANVLLYADLRGSNQGNII
jgi:LDH2 family malate/lactate/ureidoglycolate dehydrogenase